MTNLQDIFAAARDSDAYWFGRSKHHVAAQLQDLLKASGQTQEQLAAALGVKPPQVSRILNAQGNPTLQTLVKMGRALGYVPRVSFVPVNAQSQGVNALYDQNAMDSANAQGESQAIANDTERTGGLVRAAPKRHRKALAAA